MAGVPMGGQRDHGGNSDGRPVRTGLGAHTRELLRVHGGDMPGASVSDIENTAGPPMGALREVEETVDPHELYSN